MFVPNFLAGRSHPPRAWLTGTAFGAEEHHSSWAWCIASVGAFFYRESYSIACRVPLSTYSAFTKLSNS